MARSEQLEQRYLARRRAVLRRTRKTHAMEVVLVTDPTDVRYLCGATEGVGGLLFSSQWAVVFTARMFEAVIPRETPGCEVVVVRRLLAELPTQLRRLRHRGGIGYQGSHLSAVAFRALKQALGRRRVIDIGDTAAQVRAVKDTEEIRRITRCVSLAERAYRALLARGPRYLLAHTENELAAELDYRMRGLGADRQAFQANGTIVASGPNSASCHHVPTSRKPRRGEALLLDWGAEKDGYRSDITRTVFLGPPRARLASVYETVHTANKAGIAAVRPGVQCETVAAAGWNVVRNAGYDDLVRHGLGHGIGLGVHELPFLGMGRTGTAHAARPRLRQGMVITIEPGIYLDRRGGVRIEDDVLVTADGHRTLTTLPRDLATAVLDA